jgi:hypothetical protein
MVAFCKCGQEIPQGRVDILVKAGFPMTCIRCSSVAKVAGYNPRGHKGLEDIVIVPQDVADIYYRISRRNGLITSGMKTKL